MIKLLVDGQEVEVEEGSTLMQACEKNGAEIPRFCFHDRLSIAGNCRMCLVELEGSPKPVASCAMPASEGMKIITKSSSVKKAREGVMEFLLINHPLDCPICDQGGECDLQDQALYYGRGMSRFEEDKRAVDNKPFGPLIKTTMTRCIHCTRCVRFMDEVAGVHELGAVGRGEDMEIFSSSPSGLGGELNGNIIDLCPVGALTSAPYAFKARPWELDKVNSIDVLDGLGSAIQIGSKDGEVLRVLPRLNEDINEEWISDKTRFAIDGLKNQRLDVPYIRNSSGNLQKCSWEQAFQLMANRVSKINSSEIAGLAGNQMCLESMVSLLDLMKSLNVDNLDCRPRNSNMPISHNNKASWLFNPTIRGIEESDLILMIGTEPRYEAAMLDARIRKVWLKNKIFIARIGGGAKSTYPINEIGNDPSIIDSIYRGDHSFNKKLIKSSKPLFIIGQNIFTRSDSIGILGRIREIAKKHNAFNDKWNGVGILQNTANIVAGLEIGFVPKLKTSLNTNKILNNFENGKIKFLWSLGRDDLDINNKNADSFLVYQGHHGDKGAELADVILPGSAYTEKNATYINTEGRVQNAYAAVSPPGSAKEDWKIIRAFSSYIDKTLPYNNLEELRNRISEINNGLTTENFLIKAENNDIGDPKTSLLKEEITNEKLNFFMSCNISRASETMAKCIITQQGK
ncbi:MAG: NADH-quinone oxidoreductase subunit G [Pelagibacterales bacterium]|nr:NADH-quinone oxidoreductase subunit G [Pelagibacterales bacterium]